MQEWKEVEQFMKFIEQTGVNWTKSAGCNQIRAIFATGRAPRDYTSKRPTELEVDGVHIISLTQSMRRPRTEKAVQSGRCRSVLGFLPASCASDRDALTVDQTPRRGQMQFHDFRRIVAKQDVLCFLRKKMVEVVASGSSACCEGACTCTLC